MKKITALFLAFLMVTGLAAGCSSARDSEIPTLKWYMVGNGKPANYASWKEKVDAYLENKIGVHLDIECVNWGDWGNRRNVIVQTNEPYDLMFTDMASYAGDVAMGAFADLSELNQDGSWLKEVMPQTYIDGCLINGRLYAVPTYKDSSMTNFFVWTKKNAEEYFPRYADCHSLEDITEGLRAIKAGTGIAPVLLDKNGISCIISNKYDAMGLGNCGVGVSYTAVGAPRVVAVYEQPDVMADLQTVHRWMQDGLINADAAILDNASGMCSLGIAQGWPSASRGWGERRGAEVVAVQYGDTVVSNDTIQGSMTCISASSKHKEEALKLLELVNTDTWLRDALAYGEEGVNFNYVEENGQKRVQRTEEDWALAAYTQGSFFCMTIEAGALSDYYVDEVAVQNENAIVSPALGFSCDITNIADKIAACKATLEGYRSIIHTGTQDPGIVVPELMTRLRADGIEDIITEVQIQLDDYLAGR